ncbi:MAG: ABC transporter ATP-binding protein [Gemmatimonadota bacterium]|jgi:energy-coupling factor transport system ATP-binding protein|nr:energy-coupling factor transporter ATPase [Gemmatimonadota bacterium]MDP6528444.1 ABC transporter ATP-binding protein [Gemmatimonadota bacterium]MDP6802945.1 ABC transporter ATP-binding protein [Gemmatimonadota bacterium]MDP7031242.1 ABC transporter ATP-binding protein [Gemmatimonadota bacterium]
MDPPRRSEWVITLSSLRVEAGREGVGGGAHAQSGRVVLDGVDLHIAGGEYVGLVGPNGTGKSLLLQTMAGLRPPAAGAVICARANLYTSPPPAVRDSIGIVFQSPDDQIVGSTVEQDLAFALENRGVPPEEMASRVAEYAHWAGLGERRKAAPHLLSEGEKQRLALASVLVTMPDLLLLDEPTARLDPAGRRDFRAAIARAREETGVTVVHVTHRSEELLEADRIVGIGEGVILRDGPSRGILDEPDAERFGILWSPLHRLRRRLGATGEVPGRLLDSRWTEVAEVLEGMGVA